MDSADERITAVGASVPLADGRCGGFPSLERRGASGLGEKGESGFAERDLKNRGEGTSWGGGGVFGVEGVGIEARPGVGVGVPFDTGVHAPYRAVKVHGGACTLPLGAGPCTACPVFDRCRP